MKQATPWKLQASVFLCLALIGPLHPASAGAQQDIPEEMLARSIVDHDVVNDRGEKIGEVDDLIIRRSGKVKKMTMEVGGFLDLLDKIVAVPFGDVRFPENGDVAVKASVEQLNRMPEYDYFEKGLRPEYYYRSPAYPRSPYYTRPGYALRPEPVIPPGGPEQWTFSPARYLATVVLDRNVVSKNGRSLGRVQDLVIDEDAQVAAFILSSVRFLGEDVYVSLPYEPPGFTAYGLVCDITLQELKDLPEHPYED